jgi:asparagine synthase (glutamine-hydrolysing)
MCGITGWVDWTRDLRGHQAVLRGMTDSLAPRGPDAEGIWTSPRAGLGHRRLAVIDIKAGVQPMSVQRDEENSCVLTYSGELYNFVELRQELTGRGHQFRTHSDTEVLLHAYLEWGAACVERFNGMFAFAIWDEKQQELLLARDRLGIKPLYYAELGHGLIFGSEVKALLASELIQAEVDSEGLGEVVCMTQTPGHAVYRGVRSLPPGHIARVGSTGCTEHRYWRLESHPHIEDRPTTVSSVRALLEDIVERQLTADVPVGTMLSGGLDSSVIAALINQKLGDDRAAPLRTYSAHFAGSEDHFEPSLARPELDTPFARQMAKYLGCEHHELVLSSDDVFNAMHEVVLAKDLPGLADINAAQMLLFQDVKRSSTVVLSGETADEVFGGYPWFYWDPMLKADTFPWASTDLLPVLSSTFHDEVRPLEYISKRYHEALDEVPALDGETPRAARVREMFYLNLTRWLVMLLDQKDRLSMRMGVEARVPYCDHRLIEYVWNIPWELKALGDQPKGLLRTAAEDLLPAAIRNRKKTAFPIAIDPVYDKEIRGHLEDEVNDSRSPLSTLIDTTAVRELLDAEPTTNDVWRPVERIARLLQLGDWLRTYRVRIR